VTPAEVLAALAGRGESVACAESLTGGLVCAALTDVPGASASVRGGVVAYSTEVKATVLGVPADLLAERGAVDPQVAREMAQAVCRLLASDWGVATTGVAGPDPQDGRPVGTVYVAVAGGGDCRVAAHLFTGDRARIRGATVAAALSLLGEALGDADRSPDRGARRAPRQAGLPTAAAVGEAREERPEGGR
jgi:nicotinamide-nucleotide amidase